MKYLIINAGAGNCMLLTDLDDSRDAVAFRNAVSEISHLSAKRLCARGALADYAHAVSVIDVLNDMMQSMTDRFIHFLKADVVMVNPNVVCDGTPYTLDDFDILSPDAVALIRKYQSNRHNRMSRSKHPHA